MTMLKSLMLAAVAATPIVASTAVPASAQIAGVAVADPEAAIQNSNAWKTAITQIQTTHKAALDQANARTQAVQNELRRRFIAKGHKLVGWKAGLTSQAKMQQMGVSVPSIGFLTDRMARPENAAISTSDLVHPRVECEVDFVDGEIGNAAGTQDDDLISVSSAAAGR